MPGPTCHQALVGRGLCFSRASSRKRGRIAGCCRAKGEGTGAPLPWSQGCRPSLFCPAGNDLLSEPLCPRLSLSHQVRWKHSSVRSSGTTHEDTSIDDAQLQILYVDIAKGKGKGSPPGGAHMWNAFLIRE